MADTGIRLVGWQDFVRDLRRSNRDMAKQLRKANREIANEVRDRARGVGRVVYGKYGKYGNAARAIQSQAFPDAARIRLRPKTDPRILGAEFGALAYPQFSKWRGNQWTAGSGPKSGVGYAVFPTIREMTPEIRDTYGDRIMDAMRAGFPERGIL